MLKKVLGNGLLWRRVGRMKGDRWRRVMNEAEKEGASGRSPRKAWTAIEQVATQ